MWSYIGCVANQPPHQESTQTANKPGGNGLADQRHPLRQLIANDQQQHYEVDELAITKKELLFQNEEKIKRADELVVANEELAYQNAEKEKRVQELVIANDEKTKRADELAIAVKEKATRADELAIANKQLSHQNEEKAKRAAELVIANEEKAKRVHELLIANKELLYENEEKAKRAAELVIANEELLHENEEKAKRAAELVIANEEKAKRVHELMIANEELLYQNEEKAKRAAELVIAHQDKAKRVDELLIANEELLYQNEEKAKRAAELVVANEEKAKRVNLLVIANKELLFQSEEKAKRDAELVTAIEDKTKLEALNVQKLHLSLMETIGIARDLGDLRDPYTAGHEQHVGDLAKNIAAELGMDEACQTGLMIAGYLHDIGKIIVPVEILCKPGKLTLEEFALIKTHVFTGYELLKNVNFPWEIARPILEHHERMDGSGYPNQLVGDQISLAGRILAVSDVVEAMSAYRPYRPALGIEPALAEIERGRGKIYDEQVVNACLSLFREKAYKLSVFLR